MGLSPVICLCKTNHYPLVEKKNHIAMGIQDLIKEIFFLKKTYSLFELIWTEIWAHRFIYSSLVLNPYVLKSGYSLIWMRQLCSNKYLVCSLD